MSYDVIKRNWKRKIVATPAETLLGKTINGWNITGVLGSYQGQSGGHFSSGYIVEKDGTSAFLKAMDVHAVLARGLEAISRQTTQFQFERDLLCFCRDRRLSKIITLLDHGEYAVPDLPIGPPFNIVYYMVFELASGDIRRRLNLDGEKNTEWKLRVLHHAAVGLTQLHNIDVAHQDLKPSNVLAINDMSFKLSDLGRSNSKRFIAPTDDLEFPGDLTYAPPEYHYGYLPASHQDRRLGSDAYLLGSLIGYLFTGIGAFMYTHENTPEQYRPGIWGGDFSDVLPFLITAHGQTTDQLKKHLPPDFESELASIYYELCHPDPSVRGHPRARAQAGRPLGLDRYVSRFDAMAKKASILQRKFENSRAQ
ncbi:protein kinase domain-containing protein [Achromobacter insuavis]|uniref:protein kinase domain-containing protein n=1 Tax=Achromobacter insuavis TaxID=1287735 RepID=UPI001F13B558|nr:protein kinase [Achromobacter insuavis]